MATYLIGDIHGCYDELTRLLKQVKFTPYKDILWLTGDLISYEHSSIRVLRYLKSLGNSVRIALGNHDLHFLTIANINHSNSKSPIANFLKEPDAKELLDWLRFQPILQIDEEKKLIMVHAGIPAQWDLNIAKKCAQDVESILRNDLYSVFLNSINRVTSNVWRKNLSKLARLRFICNAFTHMRYCFPNGELDLRYKDNPKNIHGPLKPWFAIQGSITKKYSIAFGHWASLEGRGTPEGIYALDTGCHWGKKLTCLHWESKTYFTQPSKLVRRLVEQ